MDKKIKKGKFVAVGLIVLGVLLMSCNNPVDPADGAEFVVDRDLSQSKTVCGPTNDLQYVNQYDGSLGVAVDFVNAHKAPVGAVGDSTGNMFCSGTLIGRNLFLTASHCVDSGTTSDWVYFDFELESDGSNRMEVRYPIVNVLENGSNLDYAILELGNNPGDQFGWATIRDIQPAVGEILTIIQHPDGRRKSVEAGTFSREISEFYAYLELDTEGGSSGSGVLNAAGDLVAIHTNGACTTTGGQNLGVSIEAIAGVSTIIQGILADNPAPTVTPTPDVTPTNTPIPVPTVDLTTDTWDAATVYNAGDVVVYNGAVWEAKWYIQGEAPNPNDPWGPWKAVENWVADTAYGTNGNIMYSNSLYNCVQGHTSQTGWEPPVVPALWSPVTVN